MLNRLSSTGTSPMGWSEGPGVSQHDGSPPWWGYLLIAAMIVGLLATFVLLLLGR
jgi:hypothetical protein